MPPGEAGALEAAAGNVGPGSESPGRAEVSVGSGGGDPANIGGLFEPSARDFSAILGRGEKPAPEAPQDPNAQPPASPAVEAAPDALAPSAPVDEVPPPPAPAATEVPVWFQQHMQAQAQQTQAFMQAQQAQAQQNQALMQQFQRVFDGGNERRQQQEWEQRVAASKPPPLRENASLQELQDHYSAMAGWQVNVARAQDRAAYDQRMASLEGLIKQQAQQQADFQKQQVQQSNERMIDVTVGQLGQMPQFNWLQQPALRNEFLKAWFAENQMAGGRVDPRGVAQRMVENARLLSGQQNRSATSQAQVVADKAKRDAQAKRGVPSTMRPGSSSPESNAMQDKVDRLAAIAKRIGSRDFDGSEIQ